MRKNRGEEYGVANNPKYNLNINKSNCYNNNQHINFQSNM